MKQADRDLIKERTGIMLMWTSINGIFFGSIGMLFAMLTALSGELIFMFMTFVSYWMIFMVWAVYWEFKRGIWIREGRFDEKYTSRIPQRKREGGTES